MPPDEGVIRICVVPARDENESAPNSTLEDFVRQYRQLKEQADDIKVKMDFIKDWAAPLIDTMGNWKDDIGYARRITKSGGVSYNSAGVEAVAQTWAKSDDATLKTCGEMILMHRKMRAGSSYIQIK